MYMTKRTLKALDVLTLSLKVSSKDCGQHRGETGSHANATHWEKAEYTHRAIQYILGTLEAEELDNWLMMAQYDEQAQAAIDALSFYGIEVTQ